MNILEAIDERVSRRSYLGVSIDKESETILNDLIKMYNSNFGMSSFLLRDGSNLFNSFLKSYGMFKNVKSIIVLKGSKDDPYLKEKTGYYGQRLILKATQLGLGTCWVGGTFQKDNTLLDIKDNEEVFCIITIGKVSEIPSFKERAMSTIIHRKSKSLEDFYTADVDSNELPTYFINGYHALSKAPTALNSQKVSVSYVNGFTTIQVPDNYRFDLVDLGIGKANFELATGGLFPLGNPAIFKTK